MTELTEKYLKAKHTADECRQRGHFVEAGEWYTTAAFVKLATGKLGMSGGAELRRLLEAATCYRIGGRMDRCRNRCRMGILRAEDLKERIRHPTPDHPVHHADRGGWDECIGDLRIVGELDGVEDAYERALATYRDAGDPEAYRAETPNRVLWAYFDQVERGATGKTEGIQGRFDVTFAEFATYKRERLPEYIETLVERKEWQFEKTDEEE